MLVSRLVGTERYNLPHTMARALAQKEPRSLHHRTTEVELMELMEHHNRFLRNLEWALAAKSRSLLRCKKTWPEKNHRKTTSCRTMNCYRIH